MNDLSDEMPGLEQVRARFIDMLRGRQEKIATHAIGAWEGESLEDINGNLVGAQSLLHQISGSAGSLGFAALGNEARHCEEAIITHLDGPTANLAACPGEMIIKLDNFLTSCRMLLEQQQ